jgi:peroxidase
MRFNVIWIGLALGAVACGPPRSIDGAENNANDPDLGAADSQLRRMVGSDYGDGAWTLAGAGRPSPRWVSNSVHAQSDSIPNAANATDFLWQWGQFLDHDIGLTPEHHPLEDAPISMPAGDPFFDPFHTGTVTMGLSRSIYDPTTGTDATNPRQQLNLITAFIDASNVYGSDAARAAALRTNDGTGRLATSAGNLLPFNTGGFENAGGTDPGLFLAGDIRANEQNGLTAMHTLFMREHNRIAGQLADSSMSGDAKYEAGCKWVGALIQSITYNEYLPALLGPYAPSSRSLYDEHVDA